MYHDSDKQLLISPGLGGFIPSCYILTAWHFVAGQVPVCLTAPPYALSGALPLPLGSPLSHIRRWSHLSLSFKQILKLGLPSQWLIHAAYVLSGVFIEVC